MDKNKIKNILIDMKKSIDIMLENEDNNDVLEFYIGKISLLSNKLVSVFLETT